jgi:uncharacterized protein YaeQ
MPEIEGFEGFALVYVCYSNDGTASKISQLDSNNSTWTATFPAGMIYVDDMEDLTIEDFKKQFSGVDVPDVGTHVKVILTRK